MKSYLIESGIFRSNDVDFTVSALQHPTGFKYLKVKQQSRDPHGERHTSVIRIAMEKTPELADAIIRCARRAGQRFQVKSEMTGIEYDD